ncbi:hypothetical protein DL93DRAFT_2067936, partial [Clavulina sp. PMI_390]
MKYTEIGNEAVRRKALDSGCLPGTRTHVLGSIVAWASGGTLHPDTPDYLKVLTPDKHVLWLCGVAGSGKSSIALSVASTIHSFGIPVGFYGFSRANQVALNPSNLFSTLALQLATQSAHLHNKLLKIIKDVDSDTRASLSPTKQLHTFLIPLLQSSDSSPPVHPTVIVVDALDESGGTRRREEILALLAELGSKLPSNVQVIITTRFEHDIQKALSPVS